MEKHECCRYAYETISLVKYSEMEFLYDIVQEVNPKYIVEIGSFMGSTARMMLKASEAFLVCIDNFQDRWVSEKKLHYALRDYDCRRYLVLNMDSRKYDAKTQAKIDLMFIDGAHQGSALRHDLELGKAVNESMGTVICGHDYNVNHPEVMANVDELMGDIELSPDGSLWRKK